MFWMELVVLWLIAIVLIVYALNGSFYDDLGGKEDHQ